MKIRKPKTVKKYRSSCRILTDPNGSYTGCPAQRGEIPVQDADDL